MENSSNYKVVFSPSDTLNERLKKAAHVCPSPAQLKWMKREYICFLHFSPNTFTNRQWGNGTETTDDYHPDELDPALWASVCKIAGMKMMIPTLKHHDGFCQWNTESTDFNIKNCPVKIDVAEKLSEACRKEGIEFGIYVSPWDMNLRERGIWGTPEYQKVFMEQIGELFSNYGDVGELWLDGACGDLPIWSPVTTYNPDEWYDLMEKLQPYCVTRKYDPFCFADEETWEKLKNGEGDISWRGKEVRWVGNEDGLARNDEWSVQPVFSRTLSSDATLNDLGEEKYYENAVGAVWYPNEVNTHVMNQWFWNENTSKVRPLDELIDIYYHSMGNNGVLLLNISPDVHGKITEDQIKRLTELKKFMDDTFSVDLACGAEVKTDSGIKSALNILTTDRDKYWTPDVDDWDIDNSTCAIELKLPEKRTFDNLSISETVENGQRVAHWRAYAWVDGEWKLLSDKKTIGYKCIIRFDEVTTDRVKVELLRCWDTPEISNIGLFKSQIPETDEASEKIIDIPALSEKPENLKNGIKYTLYDRGIQSAAEIEKRGLNLVKSGITDKFATDFAEKSQDFSVLYEAYLYNPFLHAVTFELGSADGSILIMNGESVIENDEPHAYTSKRAKVRLEGGYYHIKLLYTSFRNPAELSFGMENDKCEIIELTDKVLMC